MTEASDEPNAKRKDFICGVVEGNVRDTVRYCIFCLAVFLSSAYIGVNDL